jgi:glyoxylase-like metal-dependent hydrolase (beta-lactamase superfamily II)
MSDTVEDIAPVPATAHGPEVSPDRGFYCGEIRDGIYWVTEGIYQSMFLTTGEGVVVVDACPTIADKLLTAIGEVTKEPITHVVYSHSHADHIGAADLLPEGVPRIAHTGTASLVSRAADPRRPGVNVVFDLSYTLEVGTKRLILDYKGPDHDPGNLFIYAPDQRVLMKVDVFYPGWVPFKNLAVSEDLRGFIEAHDVALEYDFDTLVSGHVGRLGTREDVAIGKQYLLELRDTAVDELQAVDFPALIAETGYMDPAKPGAGNHWLLFDAYFQSIGRKVTERVLPSWRDRLGGADVFTYDHAVVLADALRRDWGVGV